MPPQVMLVGLSSALKSTKGEKQVEWQCEKNSVLPESWSFALLPLKPRIGWPAVRLLSSAGSRQETAYGRGSCSSSVSTSEVPAV